MRIVWSTLWFLDYRIPVFRELSKVPGVEFFLIYNGEVNSDNIKNKVKATLGDNAIPLIGEIRLGRDTISGTANRGFRIPYQPGLIKKIIELNPDVMISDGFFQWTYAPLILRAAKRIPHIMCYEKTCHTERDAQLIRKIYRKLALNWIDVICCSGILCSEYIKNLGYKNSITFGHMVADVETLNKCIPEKDKSFSDGLKLKLGLSGTIYLYVGRIIKLKGVMNLLAAWEDFTRSLSEKPSLLIIGYGDQTELIKAEIKKKELKTVKYIGQISYDSIADYYNIADIFINPTLEDNWSLVVPEAMACSLPIITSVYNGCWPELVHESNGWVMDPLNHKDFVNTLSLSYQNRMAFKIMGQASNRIVQNFTPTTAAGNIYNSCQMAIIRKKNGYKK